MTFEEAKCCLIEHKPIIDFKKYNEALGVAIVALAEIQAYRAIGTVEELEVLSRIAEETAEYVKEDKKILEAYKRIGTIEEFRALREKNEPKKPTDISKVRDNEGYIGLIGKCPLCGEILEEDTVYCDCGQALDWQ